MKSAAQRLKAGTGGKASYQKCLSAVRGERDWRSLIPDTEAQVATVCMLLNHGSSAAREIGVEYAMQIDVPWPAHVVGDDAEMAAWLHDRLFAENDPEPVEADG